MARRLIDRTFGRPAPAVDSVSDGRVVDAGFGGPFRQSLPLPCRNDDSVAAPVIGLSFTTIPSAVAWHVGAIVVDAVKCVPIRWPAAYVFQELLERFAPFSADGNPTPAVMGEGVIIRVATSLDHVAPNAVLRSLAEHVRGVAGDHLVRFVAAATGGLSDAQSCAEHSNLTTAIAHAYPSVVLLPRAKGAIITKRFQPSVSLTRHINQPCHIRPHLIRGGYA